MKLIKTKTIGEHTIVHALAIPAIDPKATQAKCLPLITETDEAKACNTKLAEKKKKEEDAKDRLQKAFAAKTQAERDQYNIEYQSFLIAARVCNSELIVLNKALNEKAKEILRANPEYFAIKSNEMWIPENDEGKALIQAWMAKAPNKQILIDGTEIDDFIGKQYFYQDGDGTWIESQIIDRLGDTKATVVVDEYEASAIEKSDLTPEQLEEIRVQGMTAEEKEISKQSEIDDAVNEAANMRSKLEIQGDPEALTKSQDWYNDQITAIESKYN